MPSECAHAFCKNMMVKGNGLTFHRFPKNSERRMQWASKMGRPEGWAPKPWDLVCSAHFREEDFDRTGQNTRLRDNVVPFTCKILARLQKSGKRDSSLIKSQEQKSTTRSSKKRAAEEVIDLSATMTSKPRSTANSSKKQATSPAQVELVMDLSPERRSKPRSTANSNKNVAASPGQDEVIDLSPERMPEPRLADSNKNLATSLTKDVADAQQVLPGGLPTNRFHTYAASSEYSFKEKWLFAESRAEELEKNLHNALQREKRIKHAMTNVLEALKERNTVIENLQSQLDTHGDFPIHLFNKTNSYTTEQKNFALTLHLYGPKAYQYLRQHIHMPSTRTLRRWLSDSDECEGVDSTVLDALKEKLSDNPSAFADVALLPDVMSICKVTDNNNKKMPGSSLCAWTPDFD
ncbi:THAP domain-containing protein 4-like isoform X2 [Thalassophryne amazonica]|nr:THAP domain-containing protein 4-like isoform X2 [Thalassophryne amazonica]XP_034018656.1 THAP domain-containing protein 4-like isoform X2 [Thalassophryne amazonica]